ncbi:MULTISPECIES: hypothetical protein [unclassified Streptomyces]|uniref:hypothetical protein n=1 Tax=unclassified Streptomyces TaxID=2593676 RepID=UPI001BEB2E29|nr:MULTISPECIES: hypothetical protein [unclassified Streptomyces]MBT2404713.1 hypothetical protein [Streptomyces sp. ISL-21]MBT2612639.1 hypothetical protein [Streptomyces sp. ISL-87]
MDTTADTAPKDVKPSAEKSGWSAALLLSVVFYAAVRYGGTDGWWTALWLPLLVIALFGISYEWTVLVRARFRMRFSEWPTMLSSHIAVCLGLATALGLIDL